MIKLALTRQHAFTHFAQTVAIRQYTIEQCDQMNTHRNFLVIPISIEFFCCDLQFISRNTGNNLGQNRLSDKLVTFIHVAFECFATSKVTKKGGVKSTLLKIYLGQQ